MQDEQTCAASQWSPSITTNARLICGVDICCNNYVRPGAHCARHKRQEEAAEQASLGTVCEAAREKAVCEQKKQCIKRQREGKGAQLGHHLAEDSAKPLRAISAVAMLQETLALQ